MSSQALYRKWRSQTFNDLVGQAHVVQSLRNAIGSGRIGHAYLFTGPRGVGKTSAARILAKAVNCEASAELRPCGACAACAAIAEGRAVDVIEMDAASHTSVDDAREIIERVQFRPTSFRHKVYVIDEVHMLSSAAFNALLKTLEEPPDHAMFILATTEKHKVPETILSRCQMFVFNRHTLIDTVEHLEHIAQEEGVQLERPAAEAVARSATGSMRDAVSALDQLIGYGEPVITLERVRALLGSSAAEEVYALADALAAGDVAAALRVINEVANQGADLRQFTRDMVGYLRSLMLLKSSGDESLLDVGGDVLPRMHAAAAALDLGSLVAWLRIFSGLDQQLRATPYGQLPLEMAVVEALIAPAPKADAIVRPAAARPAAPPSRPATPVAEPSSVAPRREASRPAPPAQPAEQPAQRRDVGAVAHVAAAELPAQPVAALAPPLAAASDAEPAEWTAHDAPDQPASDLADSVGQIMPAQADDAILLPESEVLLAEIEAAWKQIVDDMKPYNPTVQALLRSCDPISVVEDVLVIGAQSPFHQRKLEDIANRQLVEDIIFKNIKQRVLIRCELITNEQKSRASDARKQREDLMKDEFVRAGRNIFDARIVGVQEDQSAT